LSLIVTNVALRVQYSADFILVFGQFRKLDCPITYSRNCCCRKLFESKCQNTDELFEMAMYNLAFKYYFKYFQNRVFDHIFQ